MCDRNKTDMHIPRVLAALGIYTKAAHTIIGVVFISTKYIHHAPPNWYVHTLNGGSDARRLAGGELLLRTVVCVVVVVVGCDVITTGLWFTDCVQTIVRRGNDVSDKAVEEVATLLLCFDCLDFDFATAFIRKTDNAPCNVVPKVYFGEPFALILLRRFTNGVDGTVWNGQIWSVNAHW